MSVPRAGCPRVEVWITAPAATHDGPGRPAAARPAARRVQSAMALALATGAIASRLGIPPGEVRIAHLPSGAPVIRSPTLPLLNLSIAHHPELVGCAVADGLPVGIDIERIRRVRCLDQLAATHLSARERRWLERSDFPHAAFLRLWTRKEAWLKAIHRGITIPLAELDVLDDEIDATNLAAVYEVPSHGTVRTLTMPAGWLVSVAAESRAWPVVHTRARVRCGP